jgi:hypothetical protein
LYLPAGRQGLQIEKSEIRNLKSQKRRRPLINFWAMMLIERLE